MGREGDHRLTGNLSSPARCQIARQLAAAWSAVSPPLSKDDVMDNLKFNGPRVGSDRNSYRTCNCVGPQSGAPFCPCEIQRRGIYIRAGRWIEPARGEIDHGPVWQTVATF